MFTACIHLAFAAIYFASSLYLIDMPAVSLVLIGLTFMHCFFVFVFALLRAIRVAAKAEEQT